MNKTKKVQVTQIFRIQRKFSRKRKWRPNYSEILMKGDLQPVWLFSRPISSFCFMKLYCLFINIKPADLKISWKCVLKDSWGSLNLNFERWFTTNFCTSKDRAMRFLSLQQLKAKSELLECPECCRSSQNIREMIDIRFRLYDISIQNFLNACTLIVLSWLKIKPRRRHIRTFRNF